MKPFAWISLMIIAAAVVMADERHTDFDPNADFTMLKSFALRDGVIATNAPELNHGLARKRILEAIRTKLTEKGFVEVAANADFVVTFQLASANGRGVQAGGLRGGRGVYRITEGTLVIDVFGKSAEPLWRGVYRDDETNPGKISSQLVSNVQKLLSEFPPKKRR